MVESSCEEGQEEEDKDEEEMTFFIKKFNKFMRK
jgi:hypothetical protein